MSYILDALKKSEAERQEAKAPGFNTVQPLQPRRIRKRSFWPALLAGALILNAGVVLVALRPWEQRAVPPRKPVQETRAPDTSVEPKPSWSGRAPDDDPTRAAAPATLTQTAAHQPTAGGVQPQAPVSPPTNAGARETAGPPPAAAARSAAESGKPAAAQVPPRTDEVRFASNRPPRASRAALDGAGEPSVPAPTVAPPPKPAPRKAETEENAAAKAAPTMERSKRKTVVTPEIGDHPAQGAPPARRRPQRASPHARSLAGRNPETHLLVPRLFRSSPGAHGDHQRQADAGGGRGRQRAAPGGDHPRRGHTELERAAVPQKRFLRRRLDRLEEGPDASVASICRRTCL